MTIRLCNKYIELLNIKLNKSGLEVQKEAGQKLTVLPRERTGHSKHPPPTTQRRLYTWTSPDGQH